MRTLRTITSASEGVDKCTKQARSVLEVWERRNRVSAPYARSHVALDAELSRASRSECQSKGAGMGKIERLVQPAIRCYTVAIASDARWLISNSRKRTWVRCSIRTPDQLNGGASLCLARGCAAHPRPAASLPQSISKHPIARSSCIYTTSATMPMP
jgi:hypothetical protein